MLQEQNRRNFLETIDRKIHQGFDSLAVWTWEAQTRIEHESRWIAAEGKQQNSPTPLKHSRLLIQRRAALEDLDLFDLPRLSRAEVSPAYLHQARDDIHAEFRS
jgi:hypothetical protein